MKIISSSQINSDAAMLKKCIDNYSSEVTNIRRIIDQIPSVWQGNDATSFINKYNEALEQLEKYKEALYKYCDFLSRVNAVYDELNSSYDKVISTD